MATWRDKLLPASFRGVPFFVDSSSVPVGRKGQLHEYPQRDDPFFEDLGRQARVHKLTAFVIGADCFDQRDRLLSALEEGTAGELVHPWLGRLSVKAGECDMQHERREGGVVRFDLTFYPAEPQRFPGAQPNTAQQLGRASEGALASGLGRFERATALVDSAKVNMADLTTKLSGTWSSLQEQFAPVADAIGDVADFAEMVVSAPDALSRAFASHFGLGTLSGLAGTLSSVVGGGFLAGYTSRLAGSFPGFGPVLAALTGRAGSIRRLSDSSAPGAGADTERARQAGSALVQDMLVVQAAQETAALPVQTPPAAPAGMPSLDQQLVQPVVRPEVPVADDVRQVSGALGEAIFTASLLADPEHFQALAAVRQQLARHLSAVAAAGTQLVSVTPAEPVPAVVLAYQRYGDASRAGEIIQRNRIRHPGFVPAQPLSVARD